MASTNNNNKVRQFNIAGERERLYQVTITKADNGQSRYEIATVEAQNITAFAKVIITITDLNSGDDVAIMAWGVYFPTENHHHDVFSLSSIEHRSLYEMLSATHLDYAISAAKQGIAACADTLARGYSYPLPLIPMLACFIAEMS